MDKAKALKNFIQYSEVKLLLDQILVLQEQAHFQSIAIISEFQGEGKSFICAALALVYSERLNKKVLVIDTTVEANAPDLLAELLEDTTRVDLISLKTLRGASSTQAPDEYELKRLLTEKKPLYSLILVDSASLSKRNKNNYDPVVIARQCDAAILVSGNTKPAEAPAAEHQKKIHDAEIKLIGMIYNQGNAHHETI